MDHIRFWRKPAGRPGAATTFVAFEAVVNAEPLDWLIHQAVGDGGAWVALSDTLVAPDDRALWRPGSAPRRVPVLEHVVAGETSGHVTVVLAGDDATVTWSFVQDHRDRPVAVGPFTFARAAYETALGTYDDSAER